MQSTTIEQRFWDKVDQASGHRVAHMESDCWLWTASISIAGYGRLMTAKVGRQTKLTDAHRVSWVLANGPIPDGLFVLHRCDNKICVRPDHLFLGTNRDNALDCLAKGRNPQCLPRTQCPKGHALDEPNTYLRPSRNINHAPARVCRACTREATKAFEKKRRSVDVDADKRRNREKAQRFRATHPDYVPPHRRTGTATLPESR